MAKITAVIDIGSNSARMAVFRRTSRFGFQLLEERRARVRISEDSYQNGGYLQSAPMKRAILALKEFASIAHAHGARKLFCVATSAVRDAPNALEFKRRARKESGVSIKIIEGEKEAFYGAIAALNLLPYQEGITIDIGGGSTECARLEGGEIKELISLDLGTIRLKELFFDKTSSPQEALGFIQKELSRLPESFRASRVIGIGGTIRALSKAIMKSTNYPIDTIHGFEYLVADHLESFKKITTAESSKLKQFGIKEDRLDSIRGGALIFTSLLQLFGAKEVVTSGVGVREGVFLSDLLRNQRYRFPPLFNPSVRSLEDRFSLDESCTRLVKRYALQLFDTLAPYHQINPRYKQLLGIAAKLVGIGTALDYYDRKEHASYFILHSLSYGFSHLDRAIIAHIVEFAGRKIPKEFEGILAGEAALVSQVLPWLSFILGLAECLGSAPKELGFSHHGGVLVIHSPCELYLIQEEAKKLANPSALPLVFEVR